VPIIEFLPSGALNGKTVDVEGGGELAEICDAHRAPVPFSCRSASCATCHIEVLTGSELLEPPGPDERELLEVMNAPPETRLACQVVVKAGEGRVRMRPVEF
jgi:ferredoxin